MKYLTPKNKIDILITTSLGVEPLTQFQLRWVLKLILPYVLLRAIYAVPFWKTLIRNRQYLSRSISNRFLDRSILDPIIDIDGRASRTEWNPANILQMTRPVPISSRPRTVISTGHARFEWTCDGGCPEVRILP